MRPHLGRGRNGLAQGPQHRVKGPRPQEMAPAVGMWEAEVRVSYTIRWVPGIKGTPTSPPQEVLQGLSVPESWRPKSTESLCFAHACRREMVPCLLFAVSADGPDGQHTHAAVAGRAQRAAGRPLFTSALLSA